MAKGFCTTCIVSFAVVSNRKVHRNAFLPLDPNSLNIIKQNFDVLLILPEILDRISSHGIWTYLFHFQRP
jgi:hypothetical protein